MCFCRDVKFILRFLSQVFFEKRFNFVERNDVHPVVQVGMARAGNNQQFLVVSFQFAESLPEAGSE